MFLWLETTGEGWRVVEISEGGLVTLLRDSSAGVRRIAYPFVANGAGKGPAIVDREDFLRALEGERTRRDERRAEGAGHEFPPRTYGHPVRNIVVNSLKNDAFRGPLPDRAVRAPAARHLGHQEPLGPRSHLQGLDGG